MAQPRATDVGSNDNDRNQSVNFAVDTANHLKQFESLVQKASEQQARFEQNANAQRALQSRLASEQKANEQEQEEDLKEIEKKLSSVHMQHVSGIDDTTQGELQIQQPESMSTHYQSSKYKDFASMSSILRPELLDGCDKLNFVQPSKIQAEAIPLCLSNNAELAYPNLIGQAHHGSGKTATFSLVMLQRIDENNVELQALVVVHSRELAIQTYNVCRSLGQFVANLKIALALKGQAVPSPWDSQICIGTPGTIIDKYFGKYKRSNLGLHGFLRSFKILIVDEADEFLKCVPRSHSHSHSRSKRQQSQFGSLLDQLKVITKDIGDACKQRRYQTLLFSATFPSTVRKLALEIAPNAYIITVKQKQVQLDNIRIFKIVCKDEVDKFNTLLRVISLSNVGQMIIFVNTVDRAKKLIEGLESKNIGIACSALYGRGMDINLRDKTMQQFRKNQTQCLVASNVIARGIDVPAVGLVVNFEIPINQARDAQTGKTGLTFDSETFMHRVGRTGRFGAKGVCINLIAQDDKLGNDRLDAIQKEYSLNICMLQNSTKGIKDEISDWLGVDNV